MTGIVDDTVVDREGNETHHTVTMFVVERRNSEATDGRGVASVEDGDNRSLDCVSLLVEWDRPKAAESNNTWLTVDRPEDLEQHWIVLLDPVRHSARDC